MSTVWAGLIRDESGQGMVEYAFIVAAVALIVVSALTAVGTELRTFFNDFATRLTP